MCDYDLTFIISLHIWKLYWDSTLFPEPSNVWFFLLNKTIRVSLWSPDIEDVWHEIPGQCWSFSSRSPWNTAGKCGCGLRQNDMTNRSATGPSGPQIWTVNVRDGSGVLLGQQCRLCWKRCRLKKREEIQFDYCSQKNSMRYCLKNST